MREVTRKDLRALYKTYSSRVKMLKPFIDVDDMDVDFDTWLQRRLDDGLLCTVNNNKMIWKGK